MRQFLAIPPYLPDQTANSGGLNEANNVYPKVDGYGPFSDFNSFTTALLAAFRGGASFIATDGTASLIAGTASGVDRYASSGWNTLYGYISAPVANTPTTSTSGGTLAAGTYYYVVTATNALGETTASNEVSVTTTGTTSSNTITWAAVAGATGYRIYRGTAAGAENAYYAVGAVTTYTDTNAASTAGSPPVSNSTGMNIPGQWRFAQFGDKVVSVNGVNTLAVDLVAGTAAPISGAPAGIAVTVVGDYVVIGQAASDKLGIYTSGYNSYSDWDYVTAGATATYQPMLTGGEVMGLAGGEYGVILQRQRIVRMSRTGDKTAPFQYDEISSNVGCASKGSVAQFGNMVFFLADSGFKVLIGGQELKNIGSEKVDRTFQAQVARDNWELIYTAIDPQSKVVIWCVPGTPGQLWIYNWELDRWSTGSLNIEAIFSGFTTSTDLDSFDVTYPSIDGMTISLDDPRFAGGNPRLYCVQSKQVGTFYGSTLKASFEFSFNEFAPGRVTRFIDIRPVTDAVGGNTISLDCRARIGDAVNKTTVSDMRTSGIMPIRCSGRYAKPRWEIAAGTSWSFVQGLTFTFEAGGER